VRCLIAGVPSGNLEGVYSRVAKSVSEEKIKNVDALAPELRTLVPADDRFEAAVRTASVPTASLARYYLRKIQIVADGKDEPQYTPNDGKAVTLEHILPQKPAPEWKIPYDKVQELYNRLGNQALLEGSVNSKIGNVGFEQKRAALSASPFSLTNTLSKAPDWGDKEISERQAVLASYAVKAWPFLV
jgi:hypothetical protein